MNLLPLFPLDLVLFPGIPLPLHIFEPRYREYDFRMSGPEEIIWCRPSERGRRGGNRMHSRDYHRC